MKQELCKNCGGPETAHRSGLCVHEFGIGPLTFEVAAPAALTEGETPGVDAALAYFSAMSDCRERGSCELAEWNGEILAVEVRRLRSAPVAAQIGKNVAPLYATPPAPPGLPVEVEEAARFFERWAITRDYHEAKSPGSTLARFIRSLGAPRTEARETKVRNCVNCGHIPESPNEEA